VTVALNRLHLRAVSVISLTIEGVVQEAMSGERLIDMINPVGVKISQVCYHPQLDPIQTTP